MTAPLLALRGIRVAYGGVEAVLDVTLTVSAGECVAVVGRNGAGKSSLLRAIMGLVAARGEVALGGRALAGLPPEARARAGLAYVPEGRRVFPGLRVAENLEVACPGGRAARAAALVRVYALFPVLEERRDAPAWSLSGGQQQMLAIGRALVAGPRLVLMDEPTLGLAPRVAGDVVAAIARIRRAGVGILLAEQSAARATAAAARIIRMEGGRILEE